MTWWWWTRRRHGVFMALLNLVLPRASSSWSSISAGKTTTSRLLLSNSNNNCRRTSATLVVATPKTVATAGNRLSRQTTSLGVSLVEDQEQTSLSEASSATAAALTANINNNKNNTTATRILADWEAFVTPERDPRKYRIIALPNNLQALLVCDEMTSGIGVEAASVHVQAGHYDDTIPGLARK